MNILSYIEELEIIGSTDYVNKRKNKYLNFIKDNDIAKKYFIDESKKINKYDGVQSGGDPVFGIALGSIALVGLAFGIYKYVHRPKCKPEYPLINEDDVPTPLELIIKILPKSFINKFSNPEVEMNLKVLPSISPLQKNR